MYNNKRKSGAHTHIHTHTHTQKRNNKKRMTEMEFRQQTFLKMLFVYFGCQMEKKCQIKKKK